MPMPITRVFTQCYFPSPPIIDRHHHCTHHCTRHRSPLQATRQGFYGQLTTLTTNEMYAVKLASSATLSVTGMPTTLPKTVPLNAGWTFVPCPYQAATALASGAPAFQYTQGDLYKSQTAFSEYCRDQWESNPRHCTHAHPSRERKTSTPYVFTRPQRAPTTSHTPTETAAD